MQQVLDNLLGLPSAPGAADLDLIFLRGIMESPIVRSLAKAHERLEETKLEAVRDNNVELVQDILRDIGHLARQDSAAAELACILREPHFQSLLETHDSVASKSYETPPPSPVLDPTFNNQPVPPDAVRMVGIRKVAGENLGVTFRVERGELVIARILHGGMVAQQGLLHVGDVIREVNGREVGSDPRALQDSLRHASGSVVLKILPSYQEPHPPRQVFVKCHFDYDPASDSLIPCKEAGLRFAAGDLLQIVNQDDPNWWQACHVEGGSAGLIPSQLLEEKRKAFVKRDLEVPPASGTVPNPLPSPPGNVPVLWRCPQPRLKHPCALGRGLVRQPQREEEEEDDVPDHQELPSLTATSCSSTRRWRGCRPSVGKPWCSSAPRAWGAAASRTSCSCPTRRATAPPSPTRRGSRRRARRMGTGTASCHGARWRQTSRPGATWSTASTRATSTAPRSTPSAPWWTRARCASWTSTPRYGNTRQGGVYGVLGGFSPIPSCPGGEGAEDGRIRALRGVHRSPRPRHAARHEPGSAGERRGHQAAHGGGRQADGGGERPHPARLRPLLRPQPHQRRPGAHLRAPAPGHGAPARRAPVGARQLGLLVPPPTPVP
uniref:Membrane palmitoylated protein 2 n=1 Tax=Anas platyrhynchos TaxID=8839 RepID=A0A8B9ST56_ANAPL